MSRILKGTLPFVPDQGGVDGSTFNKTVRLLELSLGSFDPDATPQYTSNKRDTLQFKAGDVIWNTSISSLQIYTGNEWLNVSTEAESVSSPLEATGQVGTVQVVTNGDIVVSVSS